MIEKNVFVSGVAGIIGRPNVGKSTLINRLVGEKVAIVSSKPQTTRNRLAGFVNRENGQLIIIDTPGIHQSERTINRYMHNSALNALNESDIVLWISEADKFPTAEDVYVSSIVEKSIKPVYLILNKCDLISMDGISDEKRENIIESFAFIKDIYTVSALKEIGMDQLLDNLFTKLSPGPRYYPDDEYTDQSERFLASEIVREKIFHLTEAEIPHCTAVMVEEMKERDNGVLYIRADIIVERSSQKGIILGKNGNLIKKIGELSRTELESIFGCKVYLELWCKVREKWREKEYFLKELGLKS